MRLKERERDRDIEIVTERDIDKKSYKGIYRDSDNDST